MNAFPKYPENVPQGTGTGIPAGSYQVETFVLVRNGEFRFLWLALTFFLLASLVLCVRK